MIFAAQLLAHRRPITSFPLLSSRRSSSKNMRQGCFSQILPLKESQCKFTSLSRMIKKNMRIKLYVDIALHLIQVSTSICLFIYDMFAHLPTYIYCEIGDTDWRAWAASREILHNTRKIHENPTGKSIPLSLLWLSPLPS